jgi:hypothetical protein
LLVDLFVDAHERAPREIVIDLDNTDIPLYGMQEGRFFHGYYDDYCYLPLYNELRASASLGDAEASVGSNATESYGIFS